MIKYNIIDNFLDQSIFNKMVNDIMPNEYNNKTEKFSNVMEFPWIYS